MRSFRSVRLWLCVILVAINVIAVLIFPTYPLRFREQAKRSLVTLKAPYLWAPANVSETLQLTSTTGNLSAAGHSAMTNWSVSGEPPLVNTTLLAQLLGTLHTIELLPNYKNPCWEQPLETGHPYPKNRYIDFYQARPEFEALAQFWQEHAANGGTSRIRCLPYYYIAGVTKCGTTDLYRSLNLHPDVEIVITMEPHWWEKHRLKEDPSKEITLTKNKNCIDSKRALAKTHLLPINADIWMLYLKKNLAEYAEIKLLEHTKMNLLGYVPLRNFIDLFDRGAVSSMMKMDKDNYHPVITGEATPDTFWWNDEKTLSLPTTHGDLHLNVHDLQALQPGAKIIVSLRNPTDRAYSSYLFFNRHNPKRLSKEHFHKTAIECIETLQRCIRKEGLRKCAYRLDTKWSLHLQTGLYYIFMKDWLQVFPREQIHVIKLEEYAKDRLSVLNKTFDFLELDPLPESLAKEARSHAVRNQRTATNLEKGDMSSETRVALDAFYKTYSRMLADLLRDERFMWQ